ncbi:MAG TPA: NrfD/PsrC family molybdoenzyme membrane anchor subunit [Acidimicrobiales bacterium]|nr:NrfD/PsrC family molybdoenzyme membrane anchor subunit [Acidimicrobiales bacterium]
MSTDATTTQGASGQVPGREAPTGVNVPAGGGGPRHRRKDDRPPEPRFRSYYDLPVINRPVWEAPDIPGYLFLGGLAGAGSAIALCADLTRRPDLARVSKLGAAAAGQLSLVALVHDLGRSGRFLNMLRVFKVTSPMSVGSWLLAGFVPAATVSAFSAATGRTRLIGHATSVAAATLGPAVATYTAALISDTAVPAWHDGHEFMPFIFVSSAASAASGWGLMLAPAAQTGPLARLGAVAGVAEVALSKVHEQKIGVVKEAYHEGKAGRYMKAAELTTVAGALATATSGRSRTRRVLGGALLLVGSALTRFGIFEAGIASSEDPKYTVIPQQARRKGSSS